MSIIVREELLFLMPFKVIGTFYRRYCAPITSLGLGFGRTGTVRAVGSFASSTLAI
jgi:hypothetical protein